MVRLADIAKKAKVSTGTVSAVLSGGTKGNIRVSKEKRERILAIAKEMDYIPNISARMLAGISSHTLGILVDSEDVEVRFRQLAAIEREADRHGYRVFIAETHANPEKHFLNCRMLFQYGVDAVLSSVDDTNPEIQKLSSVIYYGAEPLAGYPSIYYDIASGYSEAAALFRKENRKNAALFVCSKSGFFASIRARKKAFLAEYPDGEANIFSISTDSMRSENIRESFGRIAEEIIIPRKIDAVFMQNDLWAQALVGELLLRGIRIPEDISVIGQDNSDFCCCVRPALSTIDPNLNAYAKAIVELALERIQHPDFPIRSIAVPTFLRTRETTKG